MKMFGKRTLALMMTACMMLSSIVMTVGAQTKDQFSDFPNNWSTEAMTAAVDNGLLRGYEDGTIRPDGSLTRAEMATIINRAFGAVIEADISAYTDVNPKAWYYKEIAKGVNMRTFQGAGGGNMYPDNNITREETFAVIARAMVLSENDTAVLDKFADKDRISAWASGAVAALVKRGYVNGDDTSCVNPKANITRAEFATIMHNIFKKYITAEGKYSETVNGCLMVNKPDVTLSNMTVHGDLVIGDGVHTGQIVLDGVTVFGRILVRGAQKPGMVAMKNVKITSNVVVNNVNGTVYFDNYRTERVFSSLVANTPAEFKQSTGGGNVGGGIASLANYTVIHYLQNLDLSTYDEEIEETLTGRVGRTVEARPEDFEGFVFNEGKSIVSGEVKRNDSLLLELYYDRQEFDYTVEIYTQKADAEGYDMLSLTRQGIFGATVSVTDGDKTAPGGYQLNEGKSVFSGKVTADGKLVLKVYFDKIGTPVTYANVIFYNKSAQVGEPVQVAVGATVAEEKIPAHGVQFNGFVKNASISAIYTEDYQHIVNFRWWYKDLTRDGAGNITDTVWKEFTKETKVEQDDLEEGNLNVYVLSGKFTAKAALNGQKLELSAFYEPHTRAADTIKDILYQGKKNGAVVDALELSGYWDTVRENGKVQKVLDTDDNILMLKAMVRFSQVIQEDVADFVTRNAKTSFEDSAELKEAFVKYIELAVDGSHPDVYSKTKDLMEKTIHDALDKNITVLKNDMKALLEEVLADQTKFESLVYLLTGETWATLQGVYTKQQVVDEILDTLNTPGDARSKLVVEMVKYLLTDEFEGERTDLIDDVIVYLNENTTVRDQLVEDAIAILYQAEFDTLVYQLENDNQFTITEETEFIADSLKHMLLNDYSYDNFVAASMPEYLKKAFEIYPEQTLKDIYNDAINYLLAQVEAAKLSVQNGQPGKIDCGITVVINPIADVYAPLYTGLKAQIENKGNKFYYSENKYLQELVALLDPANMVSGTAVLRENKYESTVSGYQILTLDAYYDILYKAAVLADDAILWYHEKLDGGAKVDEVSDAYEALVLKYVNIIADMMEAYAEDGTLPNSNLTPIEQAIKNAYPELVQKLVDKYENSQFNKDYNGDDYQKLQDTVAKIIKEVNMTTDELFDKVLAHEYAGKVDQLTAVSKDEYNLTFKEIVLTVLRELTRS